MFDDAIRCGAIADCPGTDVFPASATGKNCLAGLHELTRSQLFYRQNFHKLHAPSVLVLSKVLIGGSMLLLCLTRGTSSFDCPGAVLFEGPTYSHGPARGYIGADCFRLNAYFFFHVIFLPFPDDEFPGTTLHLYG